VTWRDEAAGWPQRLETDRALVVDADSVGVRFEGPNDSEVNIVLYCGGWADLDAVRTVTPCSEIVCECLNVGAPQAFGALLDPPVVCFLGEVPLPTT
jgi:hypothetical protein